MSDVAHPTTKKAAGADKARKRPSAKPQRAETKPAPHGQRIKPVIDPALLKKVNEEILKRSKVNNHRCFNYLIALICFRKKNLLKTRKQLLNIWLKKVPLLKKSLPSCKAVVERRRKLVV